MLLVNFSLSLLQATEYRGTVGKLSAIFTLDWNEDGSVKGSYYHPARPGVTYQLAGKNLSAGTLYLEEFSGPKLTARCDLSKQVNGDVISWVGEMRNLDGRTFPLSFARETGEVAVVAAESNHYFGNVGRKAAEYDLLWGKDGSVTGSYFYPDRPATLYQLLGTNLTEGELYLAEYTGKNLTARCQLWKRVEAGEILWEGEMRNLDGRDFPMSLRRVREAPVVEQTRIDDYEAEHRAVEAAIRPEYRWDTFSKADLVVDRVPIGLQNGQSFVAIVTAFEETGTSMILSFQIGEWDSSGNVHYEGGRQLTLQMARSFPIESAKIVGQPITLLFDREGDLFSVELLEVAVTHVRDSPSGKLEIRGIIDLNDPNENEVQDEAALRIKMRSAPVVEFIPDKIALFHDPDSMEDGTSFQTLRLVRDYGISIQATAAGPGSLELESLSLEPEINPWIELRLLKEKLQAPPNQHTGQAG